VKDYMGPGAPRMPIHDAAQIKAAATYNAAADTYDDPERGRVKDTCLAFIRQSAVMAVEANVVYAIATKAS
jgi:hypothetical protein